MERTIHQAPSELPRGQTLEEFKRSVMDVEGVSLADLHPMSIVVAQTHSSVYRLVVLEDRPFVLVQGGAYFPDPTKVFFHGSSLVGGPVKAYWIGVGLQMELGSLFDRVITSPVSSIEVEEPQPF